MSRSSEAGRNVWIVSSKRSCGFKDGMYKRNIWKCHKHSGLMKIQFKNLDESMGVENLV